MRILYVNVIEQHAGWGAEWFMNRGFLANGHTVVNIDFRKHRYFLVEKFLEINDAFDVLFLQRGDHFPIALLGATNRPRVFWASELVSRCRDQDRLLYSGLFGHIFVHSENCRLTVLRSSGLKDDQVTVLLNGFDEETHYRIPGLARDIDVLFVGNVLPRRRKLLDTLKRRFSVVEAQAFGLEMTRLMNRAKIVLNIHAEEFLDTETRVFEALGCGSFLLSEKLSVDNPFTPGYHYVEADGIRDLEDKIKYYLEHGEMRERIADQGFKDAVAQHSYVQRARDVAQIFARLIRNDQTPPFDVARLHAYKKTETLKRFGGDVLALAKNIRRTIIARKGS